MTGWRYTAKEDVGFGPSIYSSIDEPYPGAKPRQTHITAAEHAAKAQEEATRDPSAGPQLERELEGHKGAATAVAFLPGGGPLVSGGADGTVRVWNSCALKSALHNRKGFVYRGHTDAVTAVDCSPDGSLVASASKDRKVRLWNPGVDGRAAVGGGVIKGHGGSVRAVNFSDDGASLLTASDDKTIKIWSMPEMRFMHALTGHTHWVRTAAFDPGHSMVVVSGGDDKTVRIWHMPRKNPVQTLFGHTAAVNAVAFNPDGFSIASASADCSVKLWDVRTGRLLQHYEPHAAAVNSLCFHPSGDYLISAADDATVTLMDLKEGRVCAEMTNLKNTAALSVAFSEQGDSLAYASADGSISVYSNSIGNAAAGDTGAAAASLRASAPAFKPASTPPPAARRPMTAPGRIVPSSSGGPIKKSDIDELKSMKAPPMAVCLVGDALCILFGRAPSWDNFKGLLLSPTFIKDLTEFDQLSIPPQTLWKLQDTELLTMPEFQPAAIARVSKAAKGLCIWVHQMAAAATGYTPKRQQRHNSRRPKSAAAGEATAAAATAGEEDAAAGTEAAGGAAAESTKQSPLPSPKPQPSRPTSSRIGGRIARAATADENRIGGGGGGGGASAPLSSPVKVRGDPTLFGLSRDQLREVKSMHKPPALVKMVGEAVCMLFELPPSWSQFSKLAGDPTALQRAMKAMMSPDATYPTTEAIATTTEFVLSCGESFSPAMVKKCASSIEPVCKWVLAMVNQQPSAAAGGAGGEGAGFASVPMPVQVASVPPSVAPSSAAAAPSAADAAAAAAGAAAGGGGRGGDEMEALIGATLQRMAEQLDVLTVRNALPHNDGCAFYGAPCLDGASAPASKQR